MPVTSLTVSLWKLPGIAGTRRSESKRVAAPQIRNGVVQGDAIVIKRKILGPQAIDDGALPVPHDRIDGYQGHVDLETKTASRGFLDLLLLEQSIWCCARHFVDCRRHAFCPGGEGHCQ